MGAIKDLWQSERGIVTIALIAACTALCVASAMSVEQWLEYTKWVFITYVAAKTVTGAVAMATASDPPRPAIPASPSSAIISTASTTPPKAP